ncbi:MAG: alpha/beta fold hydrolase [Alphaproteobacteria bacterium]|nr:alpha/beta fold hydrolase [Alphaproteobacteria bacterium]
MLLLLLAACGAPERLGPGDAGVRYTLYETLRDEVAGQARLLRTDDGWSEWIELDVDGAPGASREATLRVDEGGVRALDAVHRRGRAWTQTGLAWSAAGFAVTHRRGLALRHVAAEGPRGAVVEGGDIGEGPGFGGGLALWAWLASSRQVGEIEAFDPYLSATVPLSVEVRERRGLVSTEGLVSARRLFVRTAAEGHTLWVAEADDALLAVDHVAGRQAIRDDITLPVTVARPQPPGVVERPLRVERDGVTLAGVVDTPREVDGPPPRVVLIHGSGPGDRDGNFGALHTWLFRELGLRLAQAGFAVARYDKRGVGESTPTVDDLPVTLQDLTGDVAAVQDAVGGGCHFLVGHSEGGMIAPLRASQDPRVKGVVMLGGPAAALDRILLDQLRLILAAHGLPASFIEEAARSQQAMLRSVAAGRERDLGAMPLGGKRSTDWLRSHMNHDPAETLRQLDVPVLALYAAEDLQVPPEQADVARALLADNPQAEVRVVPGVDHLLMPVEKWPGMGIYADPDRAVSEGVLDAVVAWLSRQPC